MEFEEKQILAFQKCPKRFVFGGVHNTWPDEETFFEPRIKLVTWTWSQYLKNDVKVSFKAFKTKWTELATTYAVEHKWDTIELRDYIAKEFINVNAYYQWYQTTELLPVTVGMPTRFQFSKHIVITNPQVVLTDGKSLIVLWTSINESIRNATTNYIFKLRTLAVQNINKKVKVKALLLNFTHYTNTVDVQLIDVKDLIYPQFEDNMNTMLRLMFNDYSIPIANCKITCPFKQKCYR